MSTRMAELVMALVMGAFSVFLMIKSADLPVGWLPGEGPGGGAFPFWLAAIMAGCCGLIIVRWGVRQSAPSRVETPFLDSRGRRLFMLYGGSLLLMILLISGAGPVPGVGVYVSVPLFLLFHLRFIGNHGWPLTLAFASLSPVILFLFFELALTITLPKGMTDPWFDPIYDLIYG